ncbi:hypothetical protein ACFRJ3_44700 [Streptomyces sp. NPDC056696]|uniref:hypothetical protein n=1 Tax=unclassified Streptomyces TaxID=2593676 RepID=UPI0036B8F78C
MPETIAATLFLTVAFAEAAHLGSVALDLIKPVPYRYVPASVRRAEADCVPCDRATDGPDRVHRPHAQSRTYVSCLTYRDALRGTLRRLRPLKEDSNH